MTDCENCKKYDNGKHYCPKFCEVIEHTLEESYQQGRADAIEKIIQIINDEYYDAGYGDFYEVAHIVEMMEQIKEQKNDK